MGLTISRAHSQICVACRSAAEYMSIHIFGVLSFFYVDFLRHKSVLFVTLPSAMYEYNIIHGEWKPEWKGKPVARLWGENSLKATAVEIISIPSQLAPPSIQRRDHSLGDVCQHSVSFSFLHRQHTFCGLLFKCKQVETQGAGMGGMVWRNNAANTQHTNNKIHIYNIFTHFTQIVGPAFIILSFVMCREEKKQVCVCISISTRHTQLGAEDIRLHHCCVSLQILGLARKTRKQPREKERMW